MGSRRKHREENQQREAEAAFVGRKVYYITFTRKVRASDPHFPRIDCMKRHPDRDPDGLQKILRAFEQREHVNDWREIASGYLVEEYEDVPDYGR